MHEMPAVSVLAVMVPTDLSYDYYGLDGSCSIPNRGKVVSPSSRPDRPRSPAEVLPNEFRGFVSMGNRQSVKFITYLHFVKS